MTTFTRLSAIFLALFLWQANAYADLDHIKDAAEAGDAERQLELGILYEYGFKYKGNNQIPALTWYMISADQGVAKAAKLRDALQAKLTAAQVQEARDEADKLKKAMKFSPAPKPEAKPAAATPEEPKLAPVPVTAPTAPEPAAPAAPKTETAPAVAPTPAPATPAPEAAKPATPAPAPAPVSTTTTTTPAAPAAAPGAPPAATPAPAPAEPK